MSGDPFKRAVAGKPIDLNADTWNRFIDTTRIVESQNPLQGNSGVSPGARSGMVPVRNDSGEDRLRLEILEITGIVGIDKEGTVLLHDGVYSLIGETPSRNQAEKLCVLAEAIPDGEVGLAYIDGVFPASISGEDGFPYNYADTVKDSHALTAAGGGAVKILWRDGNSALAKFDSGYMHGVGKSDAMITKGDSGTVSIWSKVEEGFVGAGNEVDTEVDILSYARMGDIGSGWWVHWKWKDYAWEVYQAECNE